MPPLSSLQCIDQLTGRNYSAHGDYLPLTSTSGGGTDTDDPRNDCTSRLVRWERCGHKFRRFGVALLAITAVLLAARQGAVAARRGSGAVGQPLAFSVVISATADNLNRGDIHRLAASIDHQTRKPDEVILALSAYEPACQAAEEIYSDRWTVLCLKAHQSRATMRNVGAAVATGDVVTFLDAEDSMNPRRTYLLAGLFESSPDLQLALHGWRDAPLDVTSELPLPPNFLVGGGSLHNSTVHGKHPGISHPHPTVRKGLMDYVKFKEPDAEFQFVDDAITHLGPDDGRAVYIALPLSVRVPR